MNEMTKVVSRSLMNIILRFNVADYFGRSSAFVGSEQDMNNQRLPQKISDSSWSQPPSSVGLSADDVHLWYSSLDVPSSSLRWLEATLDADERKRAKDFCSQQARARFIACRGILRIILGRYLGIESNIFHFHYGLRGKPSLTESRIRFNLAHSGGWAIYGLTLDRNIGVDLERVVPFVEIEQFADRFLSDREKAAIHASSGIEQYEIFFKIWTAKEAYVKACGEGLAHTLDKVPSNYEKPAYSSAIGGNMCEDSRWSFEQLIPAFDLMAAIVVEGSNYRLTCWRWSELQLRGQMA